MIIALISLSVIIVAIAVLILSNPKLNEQYVKEVLTEAMARYNIPAATVSIIDLNQILYSISEGVRVAGTDQSIIDTNYFHIGSCSKSVLSYMAARLVESGVISWDTMLFDLCPKFKAVALQDYLNITFEALLSCRAGIQPYTSGNEVYPDLSELSNPTFGFVEHLLQQTPSSNPNESGCFEFVYSNASYSIAAYMMEQASGMPYQQMLEKYLVDNLGIEVYVGWPYDINPDEPWGHYQNADNTLIAIGPGSDYRLNSFINAAGNLCMKSTGFAKYVQMHLNGLLGTESSLSRDSYALIDQKYNGFSLGACNEVSFGKSYVYFDGSAGIYYARGIIMPESDFGLAIMINNGSSEAVEYISLKLVKAHCNLWWMFWV